MLPDRGVVAVYLNQSVCQVVGYESHGELDILMLFYHVISCCIIYYVLRMKSAHYHTEIASFELSSHAYILCLTLGLENHLNARSLASWDGSCPDIEAVEISSVSL